MHLFWVFAKVRRVCPNFNSGWALSVMVKLYMCTAPYFNSEAGTKPPKNSRFFFEVSVNLVQFLNFNAVVCLLLQLLRCEFSLGLQQLWLSNLIGKKGPSPLSSHYPTLGPGAQSSKHLEALTLKWCTFWLSLQEVKTHYGIRGSLESTQVTSDAYLINCAAQVHFREIGAHLAACNLRIRRILSW